MSDGCCLLCILCYMLRSETGHHVEDRKPYTVMVFVLLLSMPMCVNIQQQSTHAAPTTGGTSLLVLRNQNVLKVFRIKENPNSIFSKIVY